MKKDENILSSLPLVYSIIPIYSWGCAYLVIFQKKKGYFGNKKFENGTSRDGRFPQESFCLPCNQASLLQINTHIYIYIERIIPISGSHAE
jgi:hypothetical protein